MTITHRLVRTGEEHTPVRGKQKRFTLFSFFFFSHSMDLLDVIALLPPRPRAKRSHVSIRARTVAMSYVSYNSF